MQQASARRPAAKQQRRKSTTASRGKKVAHTPVKKNVRRTRKKSVRLIQLRLGKSLLIEIKITQAKKKLTRRKNSSRRWLSYAVPAALVIIGLIGTVYSLGHLTEAAPPPSIKKDKVAVLSAQPKTETVQTLSLTKSIPVLLNIPDVAIQTPLIQVGLNTDNTLEVPASYEVAGWYKFSPTPGEIGPAVIVGHVDSYRGPAVFWRLSELLPGQIIEVTRQDGSVAKFSVTDVKQFDQNAFPSQEVYGNIDYAGLRLITCGGTFNRATGNYSHNTVVYAKLVT